MYVVMAVACQEVIVVAKHVHGTQIAMACTVVTTFADTAVWDIIVPLIWIAVVLMKTVVTIHARQEHV